MLTVIATIPTSRAVVPSPCARSSGGSAKNGRDPLSMAKLFCICLCIVLGLAIELAGEERAPTISVLDDEESLLRAWEREPTKMVQQFQQLRVAVKQLEQQLQLCLHRGRDAPGADTLASRGMLQAFFRVSCCTRAPQFIYARAPHARPHTSP